MHFFTEPSKLDPQAVNDIFGPVAGNYRISSKHKISSGSSSKLFACQDALMLILPTIDSSKNIVPSKVNLILKPLGSLAIRMQPIKYYIFRGVDRSSYLSGNAIVTNNLATNCEFINKFHFNWDASLPVRGLPANTIPDPKVMGFDEILATDSAYRAYYIEELFNSSASLTVPLQDYSAIKVREGEWIGNIPPNGSFEFEIITDTENMPITLEYAEFESYQIDGTTPSFDPNNPTLEALTVREKVLNYIDAAAFFGLHFDAGIRIHNGYTPSGTGVPSNITASLLKKKQNAYDEVISKFLNKNVVYLDIRSERGYSYGFYQNYRDNSGDVLKLKSKSDLFFHNLDYTAMEWPLVNLNSPPNNLNALVQGDPIYLKLSTKDNDTPVLFSEDPKLFGKSNKKQFYNQKDIKDLNKKIRLFIPNTMDSSVKVNVAWQIKLQYFRESDHPDSPDSVFKNTNYLDSVFGGINSVVLTIPSRFNHVQNTKRQYVNNGSFAFVTDTGFYFNNDVSQTVLFYSELAYSHKKSGPSFSKLKLKSTPTTSGVLDRKNATFSKTTATVDSVSVDLLQLIGYNRTNNETTPECNLHLLGLSKAEWDAIQMATTSLNDNQVYLRFEKQTVTTTTHACFKYKLVARGLDDNLEVSEINSFGSTYPEIIVYGVNNTLLFSEEFATAQNVAADLLDPSKLTSYSRVKTVTYDKSTPEVLSLFTGGKSNIEDDSSQSVTTMFDVDNNNPGVNILGNLYYPIKNVSGVDIIDPDGSPYPLIVICHGNGQNYYEYNGLGEFLAQNGFIVASMSNLVDQDSLADGIPVSSISLNYTGIPSVPYTPLSDDFLVVGDGGTSISSVYIYQKTTEKFIYLEGNFNTLGQYEWTKKWDLPWTKGIDFDTFINPVSKVWSRTGSSPVIDINTFGLDWLTNSGPTGNKKADLTKTGTRLVEMNALGYSQMMFFDIKSVIDGLTDINEVKISYPEATVDRYLGTIKDGVYYLIHIISTSVSGSKVTINAEVKNAQINMFISYDEQGLGILGRANNLYPHLQVIKNIMGSDVQNNIGLIGHSRGAEAVVRSATDLSSGAINTFDITDPTTRSGDLWKNVPNNLNQIKAVISLAPTDQINKDKNGNPIDAVRISHDIPYYVLYGSMEGDVIGKPNMATKNRNSGFSIYDRSTNLTEKSMSFVYGASHNGFITTNKDYTNKYTTYTSKLMDLLPQRTIAKGYFNAFMRMHLKGESYWAPYFFGDLIPLSVREDEIYQQYQNMNNLPGKWLEHFTNYSNSPNLPDIKLSDNSIASTIITSSTITSTATDVLAFGEIIDLKKTIDPSSPHETKGIKVEWTTSLNFLTINVDKSNATNTKDATLFNYFSFRIGHVYNNTLSLYEDLSQVKVSLIGVNAATEVSSRIIDKTIPEPFIREPELTKSTMITIRLPLTSFTGTADLSQIKYVEFEFPGSGTVIMDDFEFTD